MVYAHLNRVQFWQGDVSVKMSITGTKTEPQAVVLFQNMEPTVIGRVEADADLSRKRLGVYNPQKDIVLLFSRPESIDCVISALESVKKAAFGENSLVDVYLQEPNPI